MELTEKERALALAILNRKDWDDLYDCRNTGAFDAERDRVLELIEAHRPDDSKGVPAVIPPRLTDELKEILGLICFRAGPIAHGAQAAGFYIADTPIRHSAEDEQAFVIHRMLLAWAKHGADWRGAFEAAMMDAFEAGLMSQGPRL